MEDETEETRIQKQTMRDPAAWTLETILALIDNPNARNRLVLTIHPTAINTDILYSVPKESTTAMRIEMI